MLDSAGSTETSRFSLARGEEATVPQPDLLTLCGTAFVAVFVMLVVLALAIRAVTWALPGRPEGEVDDTIVAAIATTVAAVYPGACLLSIVVEA